MSGGPPRSSCQVAITPSAPPESRPATRSARSRRSVGGSGRARSRPPARGAREAARRRRGTRSGLPSVPRSRPQGKQVPHPGKTGAIREGSASSPGTSLLRPPASPSISPGKRGQVQWGLKAKENGRGAEAPRPFVMLLRMVPAYFAITILTTSDVISPPLPSPTLAFAK